VRLSAILVSFSPLFIAQFLLFLTNLILPILLSLGLLLLDLPCVTVSPIWGVRSLSLICCPCFSSLLAWVVARTHWRPWLQSFVGPKFFRNFLQKSSKNLKMATFKSALRTTLSLSVLEISTIIGFALENSRNPEIQKFDNYWGTFRDFLWAKFS
jgi:hypothetical protein